MYCFGWTMYWGRDGESASALGLSSMESVGVRLPSNICIKLLSFKKYKNIYIFIVLLFNNIKVHDNYFIKQKRKIHYILEYKKNIFLSLPVIHISCHVLFLDECVIVIPKEINFHRVCRIEFLTKWKKKDLLDMKTLQILKTFKKLPLC